MYLHVTQLLRYKDILEKDSVVVVVGFKEEENNIKKIKGEYEVVRRVDEETTRKKVNKINSLKGSTRST